MTVFDPIARGAAARKGWENQRKRMLRAAYTQRERRDVHRDYRDRLGGLEERIQLLEVARAEQYCLLRALEERVTASRPAGPAKED